jgi:hypothetical protein
LLSGAPGIGLIFAMWTLGDAEDLSDGGVRTGVAVGVRSGGPSLS